MTVASGRASPRNPRRFPNRSVSIRTAMPATIVTTISTPSPYPSLFPPSLSLPLSLSLSLSLPPRLPLSLSLSRSHFLAAAPLCLSLCCYSFLCNPRRWMRRLVRGIRSASMASTSLPSVSALICHDICCVKGRAPATSCLALLQCDCTELGTAPRSQ